jgi:uncharacterized protein (TIGR02646 family)
MRQIQRKQLPKAQTEFLTKAQKEFLEQKPSTEAYWKKKRQHKSFKPILQTLEDMAGARKRCMYCSDSHGADVEHYRPKKTYPKLVFVWRNYLLCCSECGRNKGAQFPESNGVPMLLNPCETDPWEHVDFDPALNLITARYLSITNNFSQIGQTTVDVLRLNAREDLEAGYRRAWKRISEVIEGALKDSTITAKQLLENLLEADDDRGLLGWCFRGAGQNVEPIRKFRKSNPSLWEQVAPLIKY